MTSREQFESWLEDVHGLYGEDIEWQPERNCYAKFGIHLAWCAWQASRAAIEIELPTTIEVHPLGPSAAKMFCALHKNTVAECAKSIRSSGLKIKGE